jgi:hypothetical protein
LTRGAKKICWLSQHQIHSAQVKVLRQMFGEDVQVIHDAQSFDSAETIVRRYKEGGYDDIIVVAPLSVIHRMTELGVRPLWAEAKEVKDRKLADWSIKGRHYRFLGFKRVKRLVLEFDDLGPESRR